MKRQKKDVVEKVSLFLIETKIAELHIRGIHIRISNETEKEQNLKQMQSNVKIRVVVQCPLISVVARPADFVPSFFL